MRNDHPFALISRFTKRDRDDDYFLLSEWKCVSLHRWISINDGRFIDKVYRHLLIRGQWSRCSASFVLERDAFLVTFVFDNPDAINPRTASLRTLDPDCLRVTYFPTLASGTYDTGLYEIRASLLFRNPSRSILVATRRGRRRRKTENEWAKED